MTRSPSPTKRIVPVTPTTRRRFSLTDPFSWHYDVTTLRTKEEQIDFVMNLATKFKICERLDISREKLQAFIHDVAMYYSSAKYHTFLHSIAVLQTISVFLFSMGASHELESAHLIALFFASLCVDIGHPGLSNAFLIASDHPLSKQYGSPILENMHIAITIELLTRHELLSECFEREEILSTLSIAITSTNEDSQHALLQRSVEGQPVMQCEFLLYTAASVSSFAKTWTMTQYWSGKAQEEMDEQIELERQKGLNLLSEISDLNHNLIRLNHLDRIVLPCFQKLQYFLPNASVCLSTIQECRNKWLKKLKSCLTPEQKVFMQYFASPAEKGDPDDKLNKPKRQFKLPNHIVLLFTMYALFADDFKLAVLSKQYDLLFDAMTGLVFLILLAEILVSMNRTDKYFNGFYFWLDVICTFSLLADLSFLYSHADSSLIRPFKSFRASRGIRIIRLMRLFRIVKLFRLLQSNAIRRYSFEEPIEGSGIPCCIGSNDLARILSDNKSLPTTITDDHLKLLLAQAYGDESRIPPNAVSTIKYRVGRVCRFSIIRSFDELPTCLFLTALDKIHQQFQHKIAAASKTNMDTRLLRQGAGKLGQQLADLTIRRVIILVITLLLVLPYLSSFTRDINQEESYGLEKLQAWNGTIQDEWFRSELQVYANHTRPIHLRLKDETVHDYLGKILPLYFKNESEISQTYRLTELRTVSTDQGGYAVFDTKEQAQYEALYSILRTLFITICFVVGSLVLTHDTTTSVVLPVERMTSLVHKLSRNPLAQLHRTDLSTSTYEIKLLEDTLTKIARLLQIGFGEAGASIISDNIRQGGTFNPIVSGTKVHGIFGFCNIRYFTDITECLKEEVLIFANTIALILHEAVHSFNGTANRNLGDAFLVVWKLPPKYQQQAIYMMSDKPPLHLGGQKVKKNSNSTSSLWIPSMADNALLAFMKTMVDISSSVTLDQYRDHPLLMSQFDFPFESNMMYGLHIGWAIEGAIGSAFKIDASYLAPDVNMASRLGAATRQFNVPLLMSHCFYNCLSERIQQYCRCIDCVVVKGSSKPIALYTCDYNKASRINRFTGVTDLALLQTDLTPEFYTLFQSGLEAYFSGAWNEARRHLTQIVETFERIDGPTMTLLRVISSYDGQVPNDWAGYRELHEK